MSGDPGRARCDIYSMFLLARLPLKYTLAGMNAKRAGEGPSKSRALPGQLWNTLSSRGFLSMDKKPGLSIKSHVGLKPALEKMLNPQLEFSFRQFETLQVSGRTWSPVSSLKRIMKAVCFELMGKEILSLQIRTWHAVTF